MVAWLQFALCAMLIIAAGPVLTTQAGYLATRWRLSHSWAGAVLLATATSLPELITGLSAISIADSPNLAVGDALGSCVFNLALLALLDLFCRETSVYGHADQGHILTAALGALLVGIAGIAFLTAPMGFEIVVGHVSVYTPVLVIFYLTAMRAVFLYERRLSPTGSAPGQQARAAPTAVAKFAGAAAVVAAAGTLLPIAGLGIAETMGWRTSFVGTLLLAAATSLPELAVMTAALRMRSVDMAIGGLLGSNLFDVLIIAVDDVAYLKGSLFAAASPAHAATALGACIMASVFVAAVIDRPKVRVLGRLGWASLVLAILYVFTAYSIYLLG